MAGASARKGWVVKGVASGGSGAGELAQVRSQKHTKPPKCLTVVEDKRRNG